MRLVVIGCAGSYPSAEAAASSYLVQADDADGRTWNVLLDIGNGALSPLQRYGDPTALDAVAVSHLHSDHVADLVVLNVLRRYRPDGPLPAVDVWGPEGTQQRLADMAGKDPATELDGQFRFRTWDPAAPVRIGPLTLTPVPVEHPVPAFGLLVAGPSDEDPSRDVTLGYTGDTDECPGLDTLARTDLLLCEAGFRDGLDDHVRGIHLTGARAGAAAARGGSGRLVLTHLTAWEDPRDVVAHASRAYAGRIDVARPGAVFTL
ncbi:MBL fold metallo-hydrolase [Cellulomonas uda]|uniref:MBL fold metallo-hydrolase n=1 Tax=Cellulomonas uda TaxID=1714 RepID=A0A4Y3KC77_CELUD|nr:MBL fold metallo-hydrolase [Cellulomonas uda]NII66971.1 ribonuclease BN (tRNA processing enzyme) [Cellulomonas uda]GEA81306.1 MBL fold metallo-hydrolase [Cellulomonas uda]